MIRAKTISFIGAGKMAEALIKGLLRSKLVSARNIIASDPDRKQLKSIENTYKIRVADSNIKAASGDIMILAVKPQKMKEVLGELKGVANNKLVISIAAGIKIATLEKYMPKARIIRVMPNNPCLIGEGISAICEGRKASKKDMDTVRKIFGFAGKVIDVPEGQMDAVTALSGSGPGFIYYVIEAFMDAGRKLGFSGETSKELVLQTFLGSVKTAMITGKSPEVLREMVSSPGGTTLEGLKVLEKGKVKGILVRAVLSACRRAEELSREN